MIASPEWLEACAGCGRTRAECDAAPAPCEGCDCPTWPCPENEGVRGG